MMMTARGRRYRGIASCEGQAEGMRREGNTQKQGSELTYGPHDYDPVIFSRNSSGKRSRISAGR